MKHPHAQIITEALEDITRGIEGRIIGNDQWYAVTLLEVLSADDTREFQFKPKVVVKSTLTDDELLQLYRNEGRGYLVSGVRVIADAAAHRQIEEDAKLWEELQESLDDHKKYSVQLSKQISELENEYQKLSDEFNQLNTAAQVQDKL